MHLYKEQITGEEVMQYCLSTILDGQARLGGRIIMLECRHIKSLIDFYDKFGFKKLEKDYGKNELFQLFRILQENDLIDYGNDN